MICSDCQKEVDAVILDAGVARCRKCYRIFREIEDRANSFKVLGGVKTNSERSV